MAYLRISVPCEGNVPPMNVPLTLKHVASALNSAGFCGETNLVPLPSHGEDGVPEKISNFKNQG